MDSILHELDAVIRERLASPQPGSYTAALAAGGVDAMARKIGEEAIEVILAAKGEGRARLIEESADLVYHLLVLVASQGMSLADLEGELGRRRRPASA